MLNYSSKIILMTAFYTLISKAYSSDLESLQRQTKNSNRSLTLSASIGSNLYETSTADHSLNSDFSVDPAIVLDNGTVLIANLSLTKDLKGERKQAFNDSYAGFSRTLYNKDAYSISLLGLGFLPISDYSRDDAYLTTGLMLAPTFGVNFGHWGLTGLRASLRPSVRANFHRYETSKSGNSNYQYVLSTRALISYYFTDKILVSSRNTYSRNYSYLGNTRDSFQVAQSLMYQFRPTTTAEIGHSNGGSVLAPNGTDTDIQLFNARKSQVYFALSYTF
jgi:hypothetical protein